MFTNSLVTLLLTLALSAASSPLPPFSDASLPPLSNTKLVPEDWSTLAPTPLQVAKRYNNTGSANVVKFDQARARATRQRFTLGNTQGVETASFAAGKAINEPATSQVVSYVVKVLIGNPPTTYQLLVDTGSSNTWIGAGTPYVPTSSSQPTGELVSVTYGSGYFIGTEYIDTIQLENGLIISNQSIGVADGAQGFEGIDGILGVGPAALTRSLPLDPKKIIPTVTDNAWRMGLLNSYELGISFTPSGELEQTNGELTFGGVDRTKYIGELAYVPLTKTYPASEFVGYDQSVSYGEETILATTAGILDTGTTLVLIASDAFKKYQALTGGVLDKKTGLLRITKAQYGNLKPLNFIIGGIAYPLVPDAQTWPRSLNTQIGGTEDDIYLVVTDLGDMSGTGVDFINGMCFLERYYAVYDIGNERIGLARTKHTDPEMN
ncbi:aspartic peptidase A1 [Trametes gibbosa]|nr:aspartic peptidase A1 [Trametes gibbosa]